MLFMVQLKTDAWHDSNIHKPKALSNWIHNQKLVNGYSYELFCKCDMENSLLHNHYFTVVQKSHNEDFMLLGS